MLKAKCSFNHLLIETFVLEDCGHKMFFSKSDLVLENMLIFTCFPKRGQPKHNGIPDTGINLWGKHRLMLVRIGLGLYSELCHPRAGLSKEMRSRTPSYTNSEDTELLDTKISFIDVLLVKNKNKTKKL